IYIEDLELKRSLMLQWYMSKATTTQIERFKILSPKFKQDGIDLSVKNLTKRWGGISSAIMIDDIILKFLWANKRRL
ncbi:MAG: hypothetical protein NZ480_07450, partial [Bdellovibrionaceae bacterium]|nr:hypothetical protein [Pseudobdellovibrionaceae bacterium]